MSAAGRPPRGNGRRLHTAALVAVPLVMTFTGAAVVTTRHPSAAARDHPRLGQAPKSAPDLPPLRVLPATPARRAGAVTPERPTWARLPDRTRVPVRAVGTREDGVLDVPEDIRAAGWWRGGSKIGDPLGSTLLAAHVDSRTQGLGPYAALLGMRPGQRVVLGSAGLRQVFRVTSLRLVPQGSLRGSRWISAASGPRRLTLVTCAPPYRRDRGGYQNLAVVTAVPVTGPTRRP